jgi:spore photoproduct lyase
MLVTSRAGSFIKQFAGPGAGDIICFPFYQAVISSGCPGECSYCFLQDLTPYRVPNFYSIKGTLFENLPDIVPQTRAWLKKLTTPTGLIVGENQDGLAFEQPYKKLLGVTPLEMLIPLFTKENPAGHTLIVLSKFTATSYAEALGPSPNVVFSWSLSLPTISARYEKKVASLESRLRKAAELKSRGYRVRFRLDALAPIPGWADELKYVMGRINDVGPEMLTIGALRATNVKTLRTAAEKNGRDATIFDYISAKDASGFKHRTEEGFHTEVFSQIRQLLSPGITAGLCKEDLSMWLPAGFEWEGCHCLHSDRDAVTAPRLYLLERTRKQPVRVNINCPDCGAQHIDEGEWATRPHRTHQCQLCGRDWRPFDYPTIGVAEAA